MRKKIKIALLSCLFLSYFTFPVFSQQRIVKELQTGWKFFLGANKNAYLPDFDDSGWKNVTIPHDWAIEQPFNRDLEGSTGKLPWKGQGWYRTKLTFDDQFRGKQIYLLCDGIMAFPEIYINGKLAGTWDYGYNSFYLDITRHVTLDTENIIAVHADTRQMDSRWYPGAGIYRKIRLFAVNPLHVSIWGTQITTPIIKSTYANVKIATTIKNQTETKKTVKIIHAVYTSDDKMVASKEVSGKVFAGKDGVIDAMILLRNPRLWDIENPHLYKVKTEIYDGNELTDLYESSFGVRTMRFTANNGFYLNDRRIQFKGVNLHHDHGPLGAAFYPRAMERQIEIMKQMGCNAIRTSHNGPAPELPELCDKMGILVFYEFFDKYDKKACILDTTDFDDFAYRNVRNYVRRDRNHPCIFIWSVGNETRDVQRNKDNGFQRLHTMVNYTGKFDHTRPVTMACDVEESAWLRHFDYYDIHCWNYSRRYKLARMLEPEEPVIISESASTVSTRGFYELPLPAKKTDFTDAFQVSSYDLNTPWWAEIPDDDFMWQQQEPYVAGEFVWTGFDYIGEPTPYSEWYLKRIGLTVKNESRSSYFGIVDLCGIPKDRYYLYKSYWKPDENMVHILPHWNWKGKEGDTIPVFVYTNGDCAELFLNGKSLGKTCKKPDSKISTERYRLMWKDVIYSPGELKAVAFKEGEKIGKKVMKTAEEPYRLGLTPDRTELNTGGKDLAYLLVEALDKNGNICPLADNKVNIEINGEARLMGVGNGNPQSMNPFQSGSVSLFYGRAMIIVGSEYTKGTANIEVSSENVKKDKVTITIQ
jgi:beta-galactosidase